MAAQHPVRLLSYNVHLPEGIIGRNIDREPRQDLLAPTLIDCDSDIIGLSELSPHATRTRIAEELKPVYPHWIEWRAPILSQMRDDGLAVFSKHKVLRSAQLVFKAWAGTEFFANKGALFAAISTPSGTVEVLLTHLNANFDDKAVNARTQQLLELKEFLYANSDPSVPCFIMGDFNVVDNSSEYQRIISTSMAPGFYDTHAALMKRPKPTFCTGHRIDYIFFRRGLASQTYPVGAEVFKFELAHSLPTHDYISDHYAVQVSFLSDPELGAKPWWGAIPKPSVWGHILCKNSKVLESEGLSVKVSDPSELDSQMWRIDGLLIISKIGNVALDVDNSKVIVMPVSDSSTQHWEFFGDVIMHVETKKVLDFNTKPGYPVILWKQHGKTNQQFQFVPV